MSQSMSQQEKLSFYIEKDNNVKISELLQNKSALQIHKAFNTAINMGSFKVTKSLINDSRFTPSEKEIDSSLYVIVFYGYSDILGLFFDSNKIEVTCVYKLFSIGFKFGHIDIIKVLVEKINIDLSINSNAALILAIERNYKEIIELLFNDSMVRKKFKKQNLKKYNQLLKQQTKKIIEEF
jgi:hypothetical protein